MIAQKTTLQWLEHRAGVRQLSRHPREYRCKAIELNDRGNAFVAAYGRREIRGYVGFVDLVGYSTAVVGRSPKEAAAFLRPFLSAVVDAAVEAGALVDKTIGDEVMFVLPDGEDDGGVPGVLAAGPLLGGLYETQRKLGPQYSFRLGLSYGNQYVDRIGGEGYGEWTLVGESVNLAKRLCALKELETIDGIGGAFGVLVREVDDKKFQSILQVIASSRMTHQIRPGTVELKGVSPARYAILSPNPQSTIDVRE